MTKRNILSSRCKVTGVTTISESIQERKFSIFITSQQNDHSLNHSSFNRKRNGKLKGWYNIIFQLSLRSLNFPTACEYGTNNFVTAACNTIKYGRFFCYAVGNARTTERSKHLKRVEKSNGNIHTSIL